MPKVKIDYSNTIFYKIYCKDTSIKDIYIGHTTNFVQRKHSHKQCCINPKSSNYKCKLYNFIRDNMGWDNWIMEIIAFHNCEDLHSAKKQEQYYFEEYNATLNSIEPLPLGKSKPKSIVDKIPREPLYCKTCKVYFNTRKLQEEHNKRPRHLKLLQSSNYSTISENITMRHQETTKTNPKYICEKCDYKCFKNSEFQKHLKTNKHNATECYTNVTVNSFKCHCGKTYKHSSSFYRHKKTCIQSDNNSITETSIHQEFEYTNNKKQLLLKLLKQNNEILKLLSKENH